LATETAEPTRLKGDRSYAINVAVGLGLIGMFAGVTRIQPITTLSHWGHPYLVFALCAVGVVVQPLLPKRRWRDVFLALSLGGCALQLGTDAIGAIGYAVLVVVLARAPGPVFPRALLALGLWVAASVPKLWMDASHFRLHLPFYLYWVGIPFAAIYLIVERARGVLDDISWRDECMYLLALPRFYIGFYQPISPAKFFASEETGPSAKRAWMGLALGTYGAALEFLRLHMVFVTHHKRGTPIPAGVPQVEWLLPANNAVYAYIVNASCIFIAVGLFRVLGYNLGSGFRYPLASRSFSEFFRRWNYYIYDAVMSLFFFPLVGRFRRWMPLGAAAIVGAYLAILFGSFGLNTVLVPMAAAKDAFGTARRLLAPEHIFFYAVYWSAIILPQLGRLGFTPSGEPPSRKRRVLQHALFVFLLLLFGRAAYRAGVTVI
jgi:hypothetical protein